MEANKLDLLMQATNGMEYAWQTEIDPRPDHSNLRIEATDCTVMLEVAPDTGVYLLRGEHTENKAVIVQGDDNSWLIFAYQDLARLNNETATLHAIDKEKAISAIRLT